MIAILCTGSVCLGQLKQAQHLISKTIYINQYDSNAPTLNFRSFSAKEGLLRGEVDHFVQTNDGFIWFSITNLGLIRFDGYHYRIFKAVEGDTLSLANDNIFFIEKSNNNGLWLASRTGIIWFDLRTYKTKTIPLPAGFPSMFYRIFEDSRHRLWVYWTENLYLYEPGKNKFTEIKNRIETDAFTGKKVNIERRYFFEMKESLNGELFIAGNSLWKINPESFEFTSFGIINNQLTNKTFMLDEDQENIWLSGWKGLYKFNYKYDSLTHYNFKTKGTIGNTQNHFYVSPKNNGQLWLCNEQDIRVFDKKTGTVGSYKKNSNENIPVTEINADGINGAAWFWDRKTGFTSLLPAINRFTYHKLLPANEQMLCQWHDVKNNTTWFGTEDRNYISHLYKYNYGNAKVSRIKVPVKQISAPRFIIPTRNDTFCLVAIAAIDPLERRGTSYTKLFLLNTATNSLTHVVKPIGKNHHFTTDNLISKNAYRDSAGNYWITTDGQGLIHYNTATEEFFQYAYNPKDSNTISNNFLYSMACGSNNTVWTGSQYEVDNVLNKLDVSTGKTERIHLFAKNLRVDPLCEDKLGNVWVSTHTGLVCYNRHSGKKYQVPKFSNIIIGGHEDSNGNIILLADDGIWFYDPVKKFARRFDEQDGIKLEYFDQNYTDKKLGLFNDSVFISDSYNFPVSDLYPKKDIPPLHFTSIKISGKELTSIQNVDAVDSLALQHNENQLSFEFAALSFLPGERNIYNCEMVGVDTGWQQLGSENSITYANLTPGNYTFKIKTANLDGVWGKVRLLHIYIIPAFWQTVWFKVVIIALMSLLLYWLYKNRLYKAGLRSQLKNEHLEAQKKEAEFKRKLSEIELTALRSQMNPHFIFNCLNSIKLYALQNDSFAASDYLTKFSRLMRLVLENSRKDRVELQSELESVRLYIEMEAMRFKEKLQYSIIENIDTSYIEIPPLLIQPYVENAIWHGLMHKETGGNITIVTENGETDSLVKITITDDGIGREKAKELKSKSAIKQKSFGMKVTSERIALINQLFNTQTTVEIVDLFHSNGEAAGTRVEIQIPV